MALSESLDEAGYRFDQVQKKCFEAYFMQLYRWNKRINLTSVDEENYITHHLLDSLSVLEDLHGETILDMGTGAGLPGVVLAIAQPEKQFTLLDARKKKIMFVNAVKTALSLNNINAVHCRVEDHRTSLKYSTVVTRAFARIDKIFHLAQPHLEPHGRIIAMKGRLSAQEMNQLGHIGLHYEVKSVEVFGLDAHRNVVTIYKDRLQI